MSILWLIKKRSLLVMGIIATLLQLCGCTTTANRIYTTCKYDNGVTYCYDDKGNFYKVDEDTDELIKVSSVGLQPYPVLDIMYEPGDYEFTYQMPGLYKGTLESVNHYLYKLMKDVGSCKIVYQDPNRVELFFNADNYSLRLIYDIDGNVRIYAVDNSGNSIEPPYLSEE